MNLTAVGELYDGLCAFETKLRRGMPYAVHKRLMAEQLGAEDIYDWVIEQIGPAFSGSILDAGCGVGYGSFRLAEQLGCPVRGISVSRSELQGAEHLAGRFDPAGRVSFEWQSFDNISACSYDAIVAVESLKHSFDLSRSLASLAGALRPDGMLIIVDDFFQGDAASPDGMRLSRDWGLERLYSESDYLEPLDMSWCRVFDLTSAVRCRRSIALRLVSMVLGLARPVIGREAYLAFRGGLSLERLYASGAMAYKAVVYRP